ncbi:CAAX protease [Microbacterium testaceum]|uniref:Abi family protein n=1 Tax=Microbacterium testaceum TaxID=2033 RepID=UPI000734E8E3|nr:Abi family protein [Microbacterium testaceum]KTS70341.1 CAAX protease [Microbacterium testaceum]
MTTKPVKPFATIDEQIDVLASRGLALDRAVADQWLRSIGYYRLSGYWYPYREIGNPRRADRLDRFVPGASFNDVVQLYEFDRKLRTLIHDGIERVEVALRSHLSYRIGSIGPLAYRDTTAFRPTFDHSAWLATARIRTDRARRHSEPIRHHEAKYNGELPIWVLTEVLDFADISKLYDGLLARDQWTLAEQLGVTVDDSALSANQRTKARKAHPLARWFEQLTVVRNTCAHHSRLWNRSFTPASTAGLRTIDDLRSLPEGQSERLYGALTVMGHLLQGTSPGTTWTGKVRSLIESSFVALPARTVAEMGFPEHWREERLWSPSAPSDLAEQ